MKRLTMLFALALAFLPALHAYQHDTNAPVYQVLLSPSNEVPPVVGAQNMGDAKIQLHLTRDATGNITQAIVDFRVNYNFGGPETLRAFHIHKGMAGQNGGVVVDPGFAPPLAVNGAGALFRHVVITDPAGLDTIKGIIANPSGYYLNLHTATNPGGAIRGQLMQDPALEHLDALDAKLDAMGEELKKIEAAKMQLDTLQRMLRDIGRVLGLTFPQ